MIMCAKHCLSVQVTIFNMLVVPYLDIVFHTGI